MANTHTLLNRLFKLDQNQTTIKRECIAGSTTFLAMAYIMFVNPNILATAGIPKEAALAATIWATAISSLIMGLWANFPVAVAPGMGINVFFAYYVCGVLGLHWTVALGATFISGLVFLALTLTHIRQLIIDAVPMSLKLAIVVGIGMFIAFIGLQSANIIVKNDATILGLGDMTTPIPLLACFGLIVTGSLQACKVQGSIFWGILITTLAGILVGATPPPSGIESFVSFDMPSLAPTLLQLDIMGAINYGIFTVIFTFTLVELFDNMGTLIGVSRKAGLMDEQGNIKNIDRALSADSVGTLASSLLGTSTVVSYLESAAGIAVGGRTGLTAIVVAGLFLISLIFLPLIALVPAYATAPALIIIGALMMTEISHISFDDPTEGLPAFLTIITMPMTSSITSGFAFGFVSYTLLKLCTGQFKKIPLIMWIITAAFIASFTMRH